LPHPSNSKLRHPEATEAERHEILQLQAAIYERDYLPSVRAFDGVRDLFRAITEHGGRVALATDCKGVPFKRYQSLLKANEYITATACGDDVEHGKPDPRLVGVALRKLALPGSQAVMVGDTPYDAEAGIEAGARAAGVLTGAVGKDTLLQAGCFAVAADVRGLISSLLRGEADPEPHQTDWLRSA
jgi:phosphoglycolate phosphatase-like HAD superfamily hydrolase